MFKEWLDTLCKIKTLNRIIKYLLGNLDLEFHILYTVLKINGSLFLHQQDINVINFLFKNIWSIFQSIWYDISAVYFGNVVESIRRCSEV
jgi:hypothetical protein